MLIRDTADLHTRSRPLQTALPMRPASIIEMARQGAADSSRLPPDLTTVAGKLRSALLIHAFTLAIAVRSTLRFFTRKPSTYPIGSAGSYTMPSKNLSGPMRIGLLAWVNVQ